MVRKVERSSKERSQKYENSNTAINFDNYDVCGRFEQDFQSLCMQKKMEFIPQVFVRPSRSFSPLTSTTDQVSAPVSSKKAKETKKAPQISLLLSLLNADPGELKLLIFLPHCYNKSLLCASRVFPRKDTTKCNNLVRVNIRLPSIALMECCGTSKLSECKRYIIRIDKCQVYHV
ncbi:hypothetical protein AHF37_05160 [Paragonimus kellicotti]|nr:hypothetical protein AHF37_05160 [Paragonimus kellicotti]